MKVLVLTRYGRLGASSRLRFLQYLPWIEQAGIRCEVQCLIDDEMLLTKYRTGGYRPWQLLLAYARRMMQLGRRHKFDLLWIEKEALPWMPAWLERRLLRRTPYVLDYDDAIFHNYDRHKSALVRRLWGRRVDRLMAGARLVVAGNSYLARRARLAGAAWVEILPTVIDLDRYVMRGRKETGDWRLHIVWIGSPGTLPYLAAIAPSLAMLAERFDFVLRVIGGRVEMPGVQIECVDWSEDSEVAAIAACDVGIMPLTDTPWEQGKCGYKLIQYMACGLPVVASPVGVNEEIVRDGVNGFLARKPEDWVTFLGRLLGDEVLRGAMGQAGRQRVELEYCVQKVAPRWVSLLRQVSAR